MAIVGTFPTTLVNGTTEDATQVMTLFAWIQSQTNANACPATVGSSVLKGDGLGGTTTAVPSVDYVVPAGVCANITGVAAIANGGTGQATQQAALNALAGSVTSALYLRGNGANVVMSAIQAADVPTLNQNTTGSAATVTTAVASGAVGTTQAQNDNTTKLATTAYADRAGQPILATAQSLTGLTVANYTGIPSWVKRITVLLQGVSTNGTSPPIIQIGSGSILTSGYSSSVMIAVGSGMQAASFTTGFAVTQTTAALATLFASGTMTLTRISGNIWVANGVFGLYQNCAAFGGGDVTLAGVLDRLCLTTVNGTDLFDAGIINISYE